MQLQVMFLNKHPAHAAYRTAQQGTHQGALVAPSAPPVLARASLGIPDTLAIFVVALVVFGPKRLPEIGKQIGKLVFEFRRASNDFKLQIEEELRLSEQQDRQKVLDMQAAANQPATPIALSAESSTSAVSTEAAPASGFEAMQKTEPPPPDRHTGVSNSGVSNSGGSNSGGSNSGVSDSTHVTDAPPTTSPEILSTPVSTPTSTPVSTPNEASDLTQTAEAQAPLTIQPPSTGTLVSALPPNHAAKYVMTAIPPAEKPPVAATPEAGEPAVAPVDATVHHG